MLTLCNIIIAGTGAFFGTIYFYNIDLLTESIQQTYNFMLFISNIQIMMQNNSIVQLIQEQIRKIKNLFENEIEVIKYNQCLYSTTKEVLINNPPTCFDLIIYTHENNITHKNDKIIFNNIPFIKEFDYLLCKYHFLQILLTISYEGAEKVYKIDLSGDSYNYYIINNCINAQFIGYYLWKHYNVSYDLNYYNDTNTSNDYVNYKLEIIDNNVNQLFLTERDELILGENTYIIVTTPSDNDDCDEVDFSKKHYLVKPELEEEEQETLLQNVSDSMIFNSINDSSSEDDNVIITEDTTVQNLSDSESPLEFPKE